MLTDETVTAPAQGPFSSGRRRELWFRHRRLGWLLLIGLAMGVLAVVAIQLSARPTLNAGLLFSVPAGPEGIGIDAGGDGRQPRGPSAMTVDERDRLWIADVVQERLVAYSLSGQRTELVDLTGRVDAIADVAVRGDVIAVLDTYPVPPRIARHDLSTETWLADVEIPSAMGLAAGLSGIDWDPSGRLLIEFEGGARSITVDELHLGVARVQVGKPIGDRWFTASVERTSGQLGHTAELRYGTVSIEFATTGYMGGIHAVGPSAGGVIVTVSELDQDEDGVITVLEMVHRVSREGRDEASAAAPTHTSFVPVINNFAITRAGDVLFLVPQRDRLDVLVIQFSGV